MVFSVAIGILYCCFWEGLNQEQKLTWSIPLLLRQDNQVETGRLLNFLIRCPRINHFFLLATCQEAQKGGYPFNLFEYCQRSRIWPWVDPSGAPFFLSAFHWLYFPRSMEEKNLSLHSASNPVSVSKNAIEHFIRWSIALARSPPYSLSLRPIDR